MIEEALNSKKTIQPTGTNAEIERIKQWFRNDYRDELDKLNRYKYLGLPMERSRFALEMKAYEKENRLRELEGKERLPEPKFTKII